LSTPDGGAWQLGDTQLVASNGRLHGALIKTLALT